MRLIKNFVLVCLLSLFALPIFGQSPQAAFEIALDPNSPNTGAVIVTNLSTGNYQYITWNMGNSAVLSETNATFSYNYTDFGVYTVTLTIWNDTEVSQVSHEIIVSGSDPCAGMNCVWPGDANLDGVADFTDILQIGTHYGAQGPPRINASDVWIGQPAQDCGVLTNLGIDIKHLDANGDGSINDFDLSPIVETNYTPLTGTPLVFEEGQPVLVANMPSDTLTVESGQTYEVIADIYLGSADVIASGIYGLAFRFDIPADLAPFVQSANFDYYGSSFIGSELSVLTATKYQGNQIDIAITRKDGINTNGFGKIGSLRFIIIGDIIDGRVDGTVNLPVTLKIAKANAANGDPKAVTAYSESAQIVFKALNSTNNNDQLNSLAVKVQPNPANQQLLVLSQVERISHITLRNALGQVCVQIRPDATEAQIDVQQLPEGNYLLQVVGQNGTTNTQIVQIRH
jgi:PKD repeat protein